MAHHMHFVVMNLKDTMVSLVQCIPTANQLDQLMSKFCQEQEINGIDIPLDTELHHYFPNRQSSDTQSVTTKCISDKQVSRLLEIVHVPLANITTFAVHSNMSHWLHNYLHLKKRYLNQLIPSKFELSMNSFIQVGE